MPAKSKTSKKSAATKTKAVAKPAAKATGAKAK